jgi:hypothetical protein
MRDGDVAHLISGRIDVRLRLTEPAILDVLSESLLILLVIVAVNNPPTQADRAQSRRRSEHPRPSRTAQAAFMKT